MKELWLIARPHLPGTHPGLWVLRLLLLAAAGAWCAAWMHAQSALLVAWLIDRSLIGKSSSLLVLGCMATAGAAMASAFGAYLHGVVSDRLSIGLGLAVRTAMMHHLALLPLYTYSRTASGKVHARITSEVTRVELLLSTLLRGVFLGVTQLAVTVSTMAKLSPAATLAIVVIGPIVFVMSHYGMKRMSAISRADMRGNAEFSGHVASRFTWSAMLLVRGAGSQGRERAQLEGKLRQATQPLLARSRVMAVYAMGMALIGSTTIAVVYFIGGSSVIEGSMSLGELTAFAVLISGIIAPIVGVAGSFPLVADGYSAVGRILEVWEMRADQPEREVEYCSPELAASLCGVKVLPSMSFPPASLSAESEGGDPAGACILRASVDVPGRGFVAVTGPSGGGKSTLALLIAGLIQPSEGQVKRPPCCCDEGGESCYRHRVVFVPQEPYLFDTTVREALSLGVSGEYGSETQMREVLAVCEMWEVFSRQGQGLEARLGEGGEALSGGERQRLRIAHALMLQPAILILDEPTAYLDEELGERIIRRIRELVPCLIVISHQNDILAGADYRIRVEAGVVLG